MLSVIVIALLVGAIISILASLFISALRERRRIRMQASSSHLPSHPLDRHVTYVMYLQDGVVVDVEKPAPPPVLLLPSSWYTRHRMLISLAFLLMLLLALLIQGGFAGDAWHNLTQTLNLLSPAQTTLQTVAHQAPLTPSQLLVRGDSAVRSEYNSDYEWHVWSYSSCSGFAMAEVMDAYGRHLNAGDVLEEELRLGVWSVSGGLLRNDGIAITANYFGFNASLSNSLTLQDIVNISNKGTPVIVSVQDSYNFPGGHLFVIRGGDGQYVYIVDSSPANFTRMTYAMFLGMWSNNHFSAILTPR